MRALAVVVVILGAGCTTEDPFYRGAGGGGHGGTGAGIDADPGAPDAAPAGPLTGQVCVVQDWADRYACPAIALAHGVEVKDLATGGMSTTSDTSSEFTLTLVNPGGAVIRVGGDPGDLLMSTQSIFAAADSPVRAPAIEEALMADTLATLVETQTEGAGVVYVEDPDGPVLGATITYTTGVPVNARLIYDDGAGGWDPGGIATAGMGAALLLDIQNVGLLATAADGRTGSATLDTASLEIGVAVIRLPAAM